MYRLILRSDSSWSLEAQSDLAARCQSIELLVADVDGVLTDGVIALDDTGAETKHFYVRDGTAYALWHRAGKQAAILSGRRAQAVERRASELKIAHVLQGHEQKAPPLRTLIERLGFTPNQVCFVGDDLADLPVLLSVGLAACPADAAVEVKKAAHFITQAPGGRGVVREVVEFILKSQGRWSELIGAACARHIRFNQIRSTSPITAGFLFVLKKIFKALTTLTLLAGGYFVYVHAFAILVEQLKATRQTDNFAFPIHDSKSLQDSIRYAIEACGPNHWAADKELAYRYYNAERGYWIYAKECVRVTEENGVRYDGKRMRMKPFLLITKSRDGKNTKIITADRAVFDLNASLGFDANSGREPLKIKHAHLEPNVWVRDDKGTPLDSSDDLKIGPLTTVDYEESTQQITTEADTHVVMQDPDMTTTGDGMVMQLRKADTSESGTSSTGFQGIERLDLLKNVHVSIRDVGKSGMLPGSSSAGKAAPRTSQGQGTIAVGPDQNANQPAKPVEPTPLDLRCDAKMQIFVPKSKSPVLVGPPAPPTPTLALFERNVVVLRGNPEDAPDQLTCDTLKLTLIPDDKPPQPEAPASTPKQEAPQSAEGLAQGDPASKATIEPGPSGDANQGLFGGLTLQRAHATGHAVWLILPKNGIKLRCNEMIHSRQLPIKPDQTYFRGDRTRPVEIVKVDVQHNDDAEETADQEKVTSVTNIWTVDLTLFDNGDGMDAANVVAHGPGRLETRPDRDQPVERIAIWQDKLIVINTLDSDNKLLHKKIDLTGNRPCFIDSLQKTSLDSASWIQVWLKPKPASSTTVKSEKAPAVPPLDAIGVQNSAVPMTIASVDNAKRRASIGDSRTERESPTKADMGGGNLQIEQLHALVDVHLLAPAKTMIARSRLDAEFIEAEPAEVASTTAANSKTNSKPTPAPPLT